ncbi:MAG: 16S rRNA (adenine(1518)-N(6)/adenine(1519)-N(6))-dimethyltransferase RsmA [Gemmatimonadales bacterium]
MTRLGQHFLTDPRILGRIADAVEPTAFDVILEIGPGRGSLTEILLSRGASVIGVETDRRLIDGLRLRIADCGLGRAEIVEGDALKLDWHLLLERHLVNPQSAIRSPQFKIAGNIPYAITSPLIEKALQPPLPERVVFLVQAEVADRIAAPPGSKAYGALSVGVQASCRVEKLLRVAPGAFRPPPKVHSTLLRLVPLAEPLVPPAEAPALRAFVTACFGRRRKQLRNVVAGVTGRPVTEVADGLAALGLDPAARPETLAPPDFVRLLRWSRQL